MKLYHASGAAVHLLQIFVLTAGIVLIFLTELLLSPWFLLMWCIIGLLSIVILLAGFVVIPLYFRRLECTVTASHIFVRSGVWLIREESIKLRNIQFIRSISGPLNGKFGMNFLFFHAYGGSLALFCISTQDREDLISYMQERGICHAP